MAIVADRSAANIAPPTRDDTTHPAGVDGHGLSAHKHVPPPPGHQCQYCGRRPAVIYDADGGWCGDECQRNDRGSETTVRARWAS
jgi:hypothetical protein